MLLTHTYAHSVVDGWIRRHLLSGTRDRTQGRASRPKSAPNSVLGLAAAKPPVHPNHISSIDCRVTGKGKTSVAMLRGYVGRLRVLAKAKVLGISMEIVFLLFDKFRRVSVAEKAVFAPYFDRNKLYRTRTQRAYALAARTKKERADLGVDMILMTCYAESVTKQSTSRLSPLYSLDVFDMAHHLLKLTTIISS